MPGVFHRKYSLDPLVGILPSLASAKEAIIPQLVSKTVEAWGKWAHTAQLTASHPVRESCCPPGTRRASVKGIATSASRHLMLTAATFLSACLLGKRVF